MISLPNRGQTTLGELATVQSVSSPNTINREDVQRKIVVAANVQGRDLRGAVNEIKEVVANNVNMPEGYRFLLLYYEFKDVKLAFVVLINLPLALIGGILIVYFTSGIISIAATIGFISLFGIATRNGILLVSRYEDLRKEGVQGFQLIKAGALDRLNPILMTAFTTGLALIPLALKGGEPGSEIQSPMAVVILGGLLSATILNLVVIPCVYQLITKKDVV